MTQKHRPFRLDNRVVWVTSSSRRLGKVITETLAKSGAKTVGNCYSEWNRSEAIVADIKEHGELFYHRRFRLSHRPDSSRQRRKNPPVNPYLFNSANCLRTIADCPESRICQQARPSPTRSHSLNSQTTFFSFVISKIWGLFSPA